MRRVAMSSAKEAYATYRRADRATGRVQEAARNVLAAMTPDERKAYEYHSARVWAMRRYLERVQKFEIRIGERIAYFCSDEKRTIDEAYKKELREICERFGYVWGKEPPDDFGPIRHDV